MLCSHGVQCSIQECLFSPSHWSSKMPQNLIIDKFISDMQQCYEDNRRSIPLQSGILYGDGNKKIDIWGNEVESCDAMILFHGGYWQEGSRKLFTSPVKALVSKGFVVGCVGYDFATTCPLSNVIDQATEALKFLEKRWPKKKLSVGGHSAGAHLALSALQRLDQTGRYLKAILFSGIYDLQPLVDTYIGKSIHLTQQEAETLSITNLKNLSTKLLVIVGADESPEFKKQNLNIVKNYLKARYPSEISQYYKVIPDEDHFSLIASLANTKSMANKQMIRFMLQNASGNVPQFMQSFQ